MNVQTLIAQLAARKAAIESAWLEAARNRAPAEVIALWRGAFRAISARYWGAVVWLPSQA